MSRESQLTFGAAVSETRSSLVSQVGVGAAVLETESTPATSYTFTGPTEGTVNVESADFTVTPNGDATGITVTPATDGSGTFSPTSVTFTGSSPQTFTYTPTSTTGSPHTLSVTDDGTLTDPASIDYTVNAVSPATSYTLGGPTSGNVNEASTNFTVTPNGTSSATVTPATDGSGTFSPESVTFDGTASAKTFTYTPLSTTGSPHTISTTNDGGLTDPASIDYTVNASGALNGGKVTFDYATTTTINFLSTTASSGGTGARTYQWYRSTTPGFTPGAGNILTGATSATLSDSDSLVADTIYYYKRRTTDTIPNTADAPQVVGTLWAAELKIGFIGDSITQGTGATSPAVFFARHYSKFDVDRKVSYRERGSGGATTADWQPGGSLYDAAIADFAANSITHVHVMLGTNDSHSISAATYGTNLANIVNGLVTEGYTVIVSYPPSPNNNNTAVYPYSELQRFVDYQTQIDALVNGSTIFQGDTKAFTFFAEHLDLLQTGSAHPTEAGSEALAMLWAEATANALNPAAGGEGVSGSRIFTGM